MSSEGSSKKAETIKKFARSGSDTGSSHVQVALLTDRINAVASHLQTHPKDNLSRHGMLKLVSQRRRHLNYLQKRNPAQYQELIGALGLRK